MPGRYRSYGLLTASQEYLAFLVANTVNGTFLAVIYIVSENLVVGGTSGNFVSTPGFGVD